MKNFYGAILEWISETYFEVPAIIPLYLKIISLSFIIHFKFSSPFLKFSPNLLPGFFYDFSSVFLKISCSSNSFIEVLQNSVHSVSCIILLSFCGCSHNFTKIPEKLFHACISNSFPNLLISPEFFQNFLYDIFFNFLTFLYNFGKFNLKLLFPDSFSRLLLE